MHRPAAPVRSPARRARIALVAALLVLGAAAAEARTAPALAPPGGPLPTCRSSSPDLGIDWTLWQGGATGRSDRDLVAIAGEYAVGSARVPRDGATARRILDHLRARGVGDVDLAVADARLLLAEAGAEGRTEARRRLEAAMAAGSRAAARMLGDMLAGEDPDGAIAAWRGATAGGDARAAAQLARLLVRRGTAGPAEVDLAVVNAFTLAVAAVAAGDCRAAGLLADLYGDGALADPRPDLAFAWMRRAADLGDPNAALRLANAYRFGRGVEPDEARSVHYLEIAARSGRPSALLRVGEAYLAGEGVARDPAKAEDHLARAAAAGRTEAWRSLARLWRGDFGDPPAPGRAYLALREAAAAPTADAGIFLELGRAVRDGFGTEPDGAAALDLFLRAAEAGSDEAARLAARLLDQGAPGVERDLPRAMRLYRLAASGGDAASAGRLAAIYRCGFGIGRSLDDAALWTERAAFLGSSASMRDASGPMLASSDPRTRRDGFLLLRQAAKRGNLDAIADMVVAYETGRGPAAADPDVAARWADYGRRMEDAPGSFAVALAGARLADGGADALAAAERLLEEAIAAGSAEAGYELARALDAADLAGPDELARILAGPATAGWVPAMRKLGEVLGPDRSAGGRTGPQWIAAAAAEGDFAARLAGSASLPTAGRIAELDAVEAEGLACDADDFARLAVAWGRLGPAGRDKAIGYADLAARTVGGEDGSTLFVIAEVMLQAGHRPAEARRLIELSVEAGEPKALRRLAEGLASGDFGRPDADAALDLLIGRGDAGDHDADVVLLRLGAAGRLAPAADEIARVMDRIGADLGSMSGDVLRIASRARDGVFGPEGVGRATGWLEQAAEAGRVPAMRALADIMLYGADGERDPERGLAWMRRAAEAGDREAMRTLAAAYEVGFLVEVDPGRAADFAAAADPAATAIEEGTRP